jgi:hypothetical protein
MKAKIIFFCVKNGSPTATNILRKSEKKKKLEKEKSYKTARGPSIKLNAVFYIFLR